MQWTYIGSNGKQIGVSRRQWQWRRYGYDESIDKASAKGQWCRTSRGKAKAMRQCVVTEVMRERDED
jgi:hypothetical protein